MNSLLDLLSLKGCFVTGTDTEIGKTTVSSGILKLMARQGHRSAGYKPIAAGCEDINGEWLNADVETLRKASSPELSAVQVNPFLYNTPCAPHLAAIKENRSIDRASILAGFSELWQASDFVVVEGVGGFCVPLTSSWDTADMAMDFALPVVLVVGLRLGCLNHAFLTAEAIRARGLPLAGWIGNTVDPNMTYLEDNIDTLRNEMLKRFNAPCFGLIPRLDHVNADQVADYLVSPSAKNLQADTGHNTDKPNHCAGSSS